MPHTQYPWQRAPILVEVAGLDRYEEKIPCPRWVSIPVPSSP